jgi:hypothetical protein
LTLYLEQRALASSASQSTSAIFVGNFSEAAE